MRIVLVYQHFMVGGVGSTKPYDLARNLVAAGHDVTVICGRGYLAQGMAVPAGLVNRLTIDGIRVICVGVDYQQHMGFGRRVLAFLVFAVLSVVLVCRLPRYDVLVASSTPLTVGLTGLTSRYVRRRPFVFEIRDLWPEVPFEAGFLRSRFLFRVSRFFEEWFYREAAAVCAISRRMCDRLRERGVPAAKLHFIPTGVDLASFEGDADEAFRRQHSLQGQWVGVYVGTHGPVNGLAYVLGAAEVLKDESDVRLVLIGEGSEKPRLVAEAARRGLTPQPLLFLDPVPRGAIPGILKACDAMLMLNSSRPGMQYLMPNKFFDYLAAGRPIIVNVDAEVTEWVLGSACGLLADPADARGLACAVRQLRADPERAAEMGRRARDLAVCRFGRHGLHGRWKDVLAGAAGRRRAAP